MWRARSRCSQVFIEMSERFDGGRFEAPRDYAKAVRGVRLRRRRSRVPWIYLVYHVRSARTRAGGGKPDAAAGRSHASSSTLGNDDEPAALRFALSAQECGNIQR